MAELYTHDADTSLWQASMEGDQQAFGRLFKKYYQLLYQYGSKICPDPSRLEDNIQELFTEIWNRKPTAPLQSVKAYLLQALKFKLYRSNRQRRHADVEDGQEEIFELSYESFLIEKEENQEKIRNILAALNQLPSRQKEVIYLKIYNGLSYEEVSTVMDINYQATRNLLSQALKSLRKLVLPLLVVVLY